MVNKKEALIVVMIVGVFLFISMASAGQMMALQGNVKNSTGSDLTSGNLTVEVWDSLSGGSLIFNSTDSYKGNITNGRYDVMLGEYNTLNLNYGQNYYMGIVINLEELSFNGVSRRIFQPSVGMINSTYLNLTTLDLTTINATGNITTNNWFNGLFNWFIDVASRDYLSFNGTTLSFNESKLNLTVEDRLISGKPAIFSTLNVTGVSNFGSSWADGGVTIDGSGNVFAQVLYVVNLSSVSVSNLAINGTISPGGAAVFNNTFDVGIAGTNEWRYGYFGTDVFIGGESVKKWMYNMTSSSSAYNSSYVPYSGASGNVDLGVNNITTEIGSKFGNDNQYLTFEELDFSGFGVGKYAMIKTVSDGTLGNVTVIKNVLSIMGNQEETSVADDKDPTLLFTDSVTLASMNIGFNGSIEKGYFTDASYYSFDAQVNATDFCIDGGNCLSDAASGNASWNQTYATTLYADTKWGYNMTTGGDNRFLKLDGSNANTNIDISNYNLTATGRINGGRYSTFGESSAATIGFDQVFFDSQGTIPYLSGYSTGTDTSNRTGVKDTLHIIDISTNAKITFSNTTSINLNANIIYDDTSDQLNFTEASGGYNFDNYVNVSSGKDVCIEGGNCLSTVGDSTYNVSYAGSLNNASYLSIYNATYDALTSGNLSWNQTYATTLYSDIKWGYNQTTATYNLYNDAWSSTYNATYAGGLNNASYLSTYNATYEEKNSSRWNLVNGNISYIGGRVGIGTTTPSAKLDVEVSSGGAATIGSSGNTATGDYAVAMGGGVIASGDYSFAVGRDSLASGYGSVSMSHGANASGDYSVAIGRNTNASGDYSVAMGVNTNASGYATTAMGAYTIASAIYSTAMGYNTIASGDRSTVMGYETIASGVGSTAMGRKSNASGGTSTAMGYNATASGYSTTAMGINTIASGVGSTAMGHNTIASGVKSTVMGAYTIASGDGSTAMGWNTTASGWGSMAIGYETKALAGYSATFGYKSIANGAGAVAMGYNTTAEGEQLGISGAFAAGYNTRAIEAYSVAMGLNTTASGIGSVAMGFNVVASGDYSSGFGKNIEITTGNTLGIGGYLQLFPSAELTCSSTTEGMIYYNTVSKHHYACNTTDWYALY